MDVFRPLEVEVVDEKKHLEVVGDYSEEDRVVFLAVDTSDDEDHHDNNVDESNQEEENHD